MNNYINKRSRLTKNRTKRLLVRSTSVGSSQYANRVFPRFALFAKELKGVSDNSVARTLKNLRTWKGDYSLINDSLQLRPFQNGNFSKRKEFAPRGSEFFPLRAVPNGMINHFYHIG